MPIVREENMSRFVRRSLASLIALAVLSSTGSFPAFASSSAVLSGKVTAADGAAPRAGVVVTLVDEAGRKTFRSSPTDARGAFTIDQAPAGRYGMLVETSEGAFVASNTVEVKPGKNRPVALSLKGSRGRAEGDKPSSGGSKSSTPTWAKWVIGTGIVLGGLIIADAVTGGDLFGSEDEASSF